MYVAFGIYSEKSWYLRDIYKSFFFVIGVCLLQISITMLITVLMATSHFIKLERIFFKSRLINSNLILNKLALLKLSEGTLVIWLFINLLFINQVSKYDW